MSVAWNALFQYPNAGEGFTQGFEGGLQRRKQADVEAKAAERQQHEQALKALEGHREAILAGAKIIRQVQPKDQAGWDQVRSMAHQYGLDLTEVPAQFDQSYVENVSKMADAFDPQKQAGIDPKLGDQYVRSQAEGPPQLVTASDGSVRMVPRSLPAEPPGAVPPQPGQIEDGYKFKGGNPADPSAWEKVGGPAATPSATFPPGGN
jgi:hypothetical protein